MQIALTADLLSLGLQPRHAAMYAAAFSDMAQGKNAHLGFEPRQHGELCKGAEIFLVVLSDEEPARVVPVTPEMTA